MYYPWFPSQCQSEQALNKCFLSLIYKGHPTIDISTLEGLEASNSRNIGVLLPSLAHIGPNSLRVERNLD